MISSDEEEEYELLLPLPESYLASMRELMGRDNFTLRY